MADHEKGSLAAVQWQGPDATTIVWHCWQDDCVLFHRPSGTTHYVNGATIDLLTRILAQPKTALAAADEVAAAQDAVASPEFMTDVAALLLHLERLGLIDPRVE